MGISYYISDNALGQQIKDLINGLEGPAPSQSLMTFKMTPYFSVAQRCSRVCGARAYGFQGFFFSLSNRYFLWLWRSRHICQDFLTFFSLIYRPQTAPNVVVLPDLIVRPH